MHTSGLRTPKAPARDSDRKVRLVIYVYICIYIYIYIVLIINKCII